MKIKNLENLEERIDRDFYWRKFELLQLKMAIEKNNVTLSKKTLIRSAIPLLCAHWEGFIRNVSNYYIVYICHQRLKNKDLKENFIAFKLKKDLMSSRESHKISVHTKFYMKIDSIQEEIFRMTFSDVPEKRIINTNSNLNFDLFDEILHSIGIENLYETKKNFIDIQMLKNRNEIVHGEAFEASDYDFSEIYNQILPVMESFKNQIIDAAENKKYLKV